MIIAHRMHLVRQSYSCLTDVHTQRHVCDVPKIDKIIFW